MKALIYYFFIFNLITNSFALEIIKKDRNWHFSGPDCASLKNIAKEINYWSEKVDKKAKIIPECVKVNALYELNITEVLPCSDRYVRDLNNVDTLKRSMKNIDKYIDTEKSNSNSVQK